jgi:hypothetical protein
MQTPMGLRIEEILQSRFPAVCDFRSLTWIQKNQQSAISNQQSAILFSIRGVAVILTPARVP